MAARRLGEQLLAGEIDTTLPPITQSHNVLFEQTPKSGEGHPMLCTAPLECFGPAVSFPDGEAPKPRIWFRLSFANVTVIETTEGLVLIDTGGPYTGTTVYEEVRQKFPKTPVHTAIYTHGHVDHVSGINEFETRDGSRARVISHEAVIQRFDRYKTTQGYNGWINARQFGLPSPLWPEEFRYPDVTYSTFLKIKVGDVDFELYHAKGETDDATWVWIPKYKALCAGDLFIWCVPNCGNPQKVQRYPREWAQALRIMAEKEAELMFPGHGPPIMRKEIIARALNESAELLEILIEQTLRLMNEGLRLTQVLERVEVPDRLLSRPYLRPVYDEPSFIIRNIWRLYGGWYDGNPAHLKPAPERVLAGEIVRLSGGLHKLCDRAAHLAQSSNQHDLAVAGHLAEWAFLAAPDDERARAVYSQVNGKRAEEATSTMARGIYAHAARSVNKL